MQTIEQIAEEDGITVEEALRQSAARLHAIVVQLRNDIAKHIGMIEGSDDQADIDENTVHALDEVLSEEIAVSRPEF